MQKVNEIKKLFNQTGWTQAKLAKESGVSTSVVNVVVKKGKKASDEKLDKMIETLKGVLK